MWYVLVCDVVTAHLINHAVDRSSLLCAARKYGVRVRLPMFCQSCIACVASAQICDVHHSLPLKVLRNQCNRRSVKFTAHQTRMCSCACTRSIVYAATSLQILLKCMFFFQYKPGRHAVSTCVNTLIQTISASCTLANTFSFLLLVSYWNTTVSVCSCESSMSTYETITYGCLRASCR